MIDKRLFIIALCALIVTITVSSAYPADNAQEQLNQYLLELQKNPNDTALREKIIRHVQGMKPAPAVPEDAERYMARGKAAFESAKTDEDYSSAIAEFKKAVDSAPWLAIGYYNLGLVQEKAGRLDDAMKNFKLYLLADPSARDAPSVKNRIYGLEYKLEQKEKASSLVSECHRIIQAEGPRAALPVCKEAVKLDPKNRTAHYNLGVALRTQYGSTNDDIDRGCKEAIPEFEEAIRLGTNLDAHVNLANCYLNLNANEPNVNETKKAIRIVEDGMRKFPDYPEMWRAYRMIGDAYWQIDEYAQALTNYQKAKDLGGQTTPKGEERMKWLKQRLGR
jgi:tetratricopeptide (TPR) repeat protein